PPARICWALTTNEERDALALASKPMAFKCLSWSITTRAEILTTKNGREACHRAGLTEIALIEDRFSTRHHRRKRPFGHGMAPRPHLVQVAYGLGEFHRRRRCAHRRSFGLHCDAPSYQ